MFLIRHECGSLVFFDTPGRASGLAVSGSLVYVADEESGLRVIDISNPARPREVGFIDTPGQARKIALSGIFAYVADGEGGLRIVDVSNPAAPQERGSLGECCVTDVVVSGGLVYLATSEGVWVIDVSNPASQRLQASFPLPVEALGIAVSGDLVFVADDVAQLFILR